MSSVQHEIKKARSLAAKKDSRAKADVPIYGHLAVSKLTQIAGFDSTLGNAAKSMLAIIAGYSDAEGVCWPSVTKIASERGISRAAVAKQIAILEDHEYLVRKEDYGENGRRRTNIISLNIELAQEFFMTPSIFRAENVFMLIAAYATLLGCRGMQPQEVAGDATSVSCINKNTGNEHKGSKKKSKNLLKRIRLSKAAWQGEKNRKEKAGISASEEKRLERLIGEMRQYKNASQMTNFDLTMKRAAKQFSAKEAIAYFVRKYEEELAICRSKEGIQPKNG